MPVTVVATLKVKPESAEAARNILSRAVTVVHDEPGCSLYSLHEGDDCFVFIEEWSDAEALQAHNAGPAVTRMVKEVSSYLDGPAEIIVARPVVTGNPAKGQLRP
jgi:quinol monooxygenase YgiN